MTIRKLCTHIVVHTCIYTCAMQLTALREQPEPTRRRDALPNPARDRQNLLEPGQYSVILACRAYYAARRAKASAAFRDTRRSTAVSSARARNARLRRYPRPHGVASRVGNRGNALGLPRQ